MVDQILPYGVSLVHQECHLEFGTDPVHAGDEDGLLEVPEPRIVEGAESADITQDRPGKRRPDFFPDVPDQIFTGLDPYARLVIRFRHSLVPRSVHERRTI